jgi:hypothetical protein
VSQLQFKRRELIQRVMTCVACWIYCTMGNTMLAQSTFPDIIKDAKGTITYTKDDLGNQIPDFSYAGYGASEKSIPVIDNKIVVPKQDQDATRIIQAAIDYVSNLKPNKFGYRGAVLLDKGVFKISGTLYIKKSGVVVRGSGNTQNGTILLGTGLNRESVIKVIGINDIQYKDTYAIIPSFLPLGTQTLRLKNASQLKLNDEIAITSPLTEKWIKELKMEEFGGETAWVGWKKGDWDVTWNRTITKINGDEVTLNAP